MRAPKLYPFQQEGIADIRRAFRTHSHVCLAWYTGAGKTNVIAQLCADLLAEDPAVRIGISAYLTTEIKEQICERLESFGLKSDTHKVVPTVPKHVAERRITVFNPQGMYKKPPKVKYDYIILDEAHTGVDSKCRMLPRILRLMSHAKTRVLLVSATPWDTLAQAAFRNAPVLKRPLDVGLKDGLITDFLFRAEEASVTFAPEDFTRDFEVTASAITKQMAVVKSACIGKVDHILKQFDRELGKKVLVICPPGNHGEIARDFAKRYGGLAFVEARTHIAAGVTTVEKKQFEEALEQFKANPAIRFLFVINKCQVGFDYQELSSVIDLTMSRNIRNLAQRMGRIARKNGAARKNYFYVYDKSLMKDRLEWLVATTLDFCLGAYDGWNTRTAKYRPAEFHQKTFTHPITVTLKEVIQGLRADGAITERKTVRFVDGKPPTRWTLDAAMRTAKQYASRTEMWETQPALYKWFRFNAKAEMDALFPLRNRLGKWHEASVTAALKEMKGAKRRVFKLKHAGAYEWLHKHKRHDLLDKYLVSLHPQWTDERVKEKLQKIRTWSHVRTYGGMRRWMQEHGGEAQWQAWWKKETGRDMHPSGTWTEERRKKQAVRMKHFWQIREESRREENRKKAKKAGTA